MTDKRIQPIWDPIALAAQLRDIARQSQVLMRHFVSHQDAVRFGITGRSTFSPYERCGCRQRSLRGRRGAHARDCAQTWMSSGVQGLMRSGRSRPGRRLPMPPGHQQRHHLD